MNKFTYLALGIGAIALLAVMITGCSSTPKKMDATEFTKQALLATDSRKVSLGDKEKMAIEQFESFNGTFTTNSILTNVKNVYAADIYFRDPFKEIHGEPDFEAYLLKSAAAVGEYSMEWKDVAQHDGDYYFRWIMTLKLKSEGKNKPPSLTTGMSHVRFGSDGKVIFHQDYFDGAAFLYEKIPLLGGGIRAVKKRL